MVTSSYIIRGGIEGFERLKILARVMYSSTVTLFDRVGVEPQMHCLDAGCGSGDVSFELARRVGARGHVVGADLDAVKLDLARREADAIPLNNVQFIQADIHELSRDAAFDRIYARFLLTHMRDPALTLRKLLPMLRAGGVLIVEDIDFTGSVCHPDHPAHARYVELYTKTVQSKGADPNIGPRLPRLLRDAGYRDVQSNVVQPLASNGETTLIPSITIRNIAQSVVESGHAARAELDEIERDLSALAEDGETLMGTPRVFQVWGTRP